VSFDVKSCQLLYFGPHRTLRNRIIGTVRVHIAEDFLGTRTDYVLDLKVKAETGLAKSDVVRQALLAHAARQLNKLKLRHQRHAAPAAAAE
jgi:hypothetical protein